MRFKHAIHCINYLHIKNPEQTQAISNKQEPQTQNNNDKTHTYTKAATISSYQL